MTTLLRCLFGDVLWAVAEVDDAVGEAPLVAELELEPGAVWWFDP